MEQKVFLPLIKHKKCLCDEHKKVLLIYLIEYYKSRQNLGDYNSDYY